MECCCLIFHFFLSSYFHVFVFMFFMKFEYSGVMSAFPFLTLPRCVLRTKNSLKRCYLHVFYVIIPEYRTKYIIFLALFHTHLSPLLIPFLYHFKWDIESFLVIMEWTHLKYGKTFLYWKIFSESWWMKGI